jgi:putative hydrolase of the HAD superfamily
MWLRCIREGLTAADLDGGLAEAVQAELQTALVAHYADPDDLAELAYAEVFAAALETCGAACTPAAARAAIEGAHRAFAPARRLHPDAHALLDGIRARGLRSAIVSNTFDPPDLLHADLAADGVSERVDAVVFSSEVGRRKPDPEIYRAALDRIGVDARDALFVGDRVREDVVGPAAVGMRTCLVTHMRVDEGDHSLATAVATAPLDVITVVDGLLAAADAGRI